MSMLTTVQYIILHGFAYTLQQNHVGRCNSMQF